MLSLETLADMKTIIIYSYFMKGNFKCCAARRMHSYMIGSLGIKIIPMPVYISS